MPCLNLRKIRRLYCTSLYLIYMRALYYNNIVLCVVRGYKSKQQFAEILCVHAVVYMMLLCHFEILLSAPFLL